MRLYLDHNATCPLRPWLRDELTRTLDEAWGNPSSIHAEGRVARAVLEQARRAVRNALGVRDGVVIFTSGATEANAIALALLSGRQRWVRSGLEHPSLRETLDRWVERGCAGRIAPHIGPGGIDHGALDDGDAVIATWANNETGHCEDVEGMAAAAEGRDIAVHVDAAQWFGRWPMRVPEGVTSVTGSAHKAGGLPGIGFLWLRDPRGLEPLWRGGSQERGRRPGTENLVGIRSLALIAEHRDAAAWEATQGIRDAVEDALKAAGAWIVAEKRERMPNTTCAAFPGRDAEELVMALDLAGIAVSAGAACSAGSVETSPVLLRLGLDEQVARSAIRLSYGPDSLTLCPSQVAERILDAVGGSVAAKRTHPVGGS